MWLTFLCRTWIYLFLRNVSNPFGVRCIAVGTKTVWLPSFFKICSAEERNAYWFLTTWGWNFIFGLTIPLKYCNQHVYEFIFHLKGFDISLQQRFVQGNGNHWSVQPGFYNHQAEIWPFHNRPACHRWKVQFWDAPTEYGLKGTEAHYVSHNPHREVELVWMVFILKLTFIFFLHMQSTKSPPPSNQWNGAHGKPWNLQKEWFWLPHWWGWWVSYCSRFSGLGMGR